MTARFDLTPYTGRIQSRVAVFIGKFNISTIFNEQGYDMRIAFGRGNIDRREVTSLLPIDLCAMAKQ